MRWNGMDIFINLRYKYAISRSIQAKMRKLLASAFCSQLRSSLRTRRFRSEVIRFGHVVIHYNVTTCSTGTTSVCSKLLLVFPGCLRLLDTRSTNRKPVTIFLVVNATSPPRLGGAMSDGFEGLEVVNCLCRKGVTILTLTSTSTSCCSVSSKQKHPAIERGKAHRLSHLMDPYPNKTPTDYS